MSFHKQPKTLDDYLEASRKRLEKEQREFQASLVEPLWYLRSIPYNQYRMSHHWKKRADLFRSTFEVLQCELCGIDRVLDGDNNCLDWVPQFHVHHISYESLGRENDADLKLLCSACHNLVHFPNSAQAKYWLDYNSQIINPDELEALRPIWCDFDTDPKWEVA